MSKPPFLSFLGKFKMKWASASDTAAANIEEVQAGSFLPLQDEIKRYSVLNGYPATQFSSVMTTCRCDQNGLLLFSDEEEGAAYAQCPKCASKAFVRDSDEYVEKAVQNVCSCENDQLIIEIGTAQYEDSQDVRWVYVGAACPVCDLAGVYADWAEK